jgi:S1-C subfamily serine protease
MKFPAYLPFILLGGMLGCKPPTFAPEKVAPGVVLITLFQIPKEEILPTIPNPLPAPLQNKEEVSSGSGWVYAPGLIVTNYHVIDDALKQETTIKVSFTSGEEVVAQVIAIAPRRDIALLSIQNNLGKALPIAPIEPQLCETVFTVGHPLELEQTFCKGIVSGLNRNVPSTRGLRHLIQTDADIHPGNSGGPLLNIRGEVVGMNTAICSPIEGSIGLGFAISNTELKKIIPRLLQQVAVTTKFPVKLSCMNLGVKIQKKTKGKLSEVKADGPFGKAGIKVGERLLEVEGFPITDQKSLDWVLDEIGIRSSITVKILRNGKELFLSL